MTLRSMGLGGAAGIASVVLLAAAAAAQTHSAGAGGNLDWTSYAADPAGSHYKPLDQINDSNFNDLEVAWTFSTDNLGNHPEYKLEGTPLEVNGVVYATEATGAALSR